MTAPWAGRAGFVIDLDRCVGCAACVVACRLENGWPGTTPWRVVLALNLRRRPAGPTYFLSLACHHCAQPACLEACPSGAYERRNDGVVVHLPDRCLGCRYCEMACPFEVPRYDAEAGVVGKCHHCAHRLDRGEPPACVAACPTEALSLRSGEEDDDPHVEIPGFADPGRCLPSVRFRAPRAGRRRERLEGLRRELGDVTGPGRGRRRRDV